eukprot:UN09735
MENPQREEARRPPGKPKDLSPSSCLYTSCYCEENVWKLCERIRDEGINNLAEYYAVFISNSSRQIPLWMQNKPQILFPLLFGIIT